MLIHYQMHLPYFVYQSTAYWYMFNHNGFVGCVSYLCLVFAASAFKGLVAEVGYGYEAAEVTHMDSVRIGRLKETLSQELGGTVSYLTISLHLTET